MPLLAIISTDQTRLEGRCGPLHWDSPPSGLPRVEKKKQKKKKKKKKNKIKKKKIKQENK